MGLYVDLDIVNDWGFPAETPELGNAIDYSQASETFYELLYEHATRLCPVRTGYLLSTISGYWGGETCGGEASADYAECVEYGTWCMGAQPYFEPAVQVAALGAWEVAGQLYRQALIYERAMIAEEEEAEELAEQRLFEAQMSRELSYNGITIDTRTGEETGNSKYWSNPNRWRPGTTMYKVAQKRQANKAQALSQLRSELKTMKQNKAQGLNPYYGISRFMSSTHRSLGPVGDFSYSASLYAMAEGMEIGASFTQSLGLGMLVGAGIFLLLSPIFDAIMGDDGEEGPHFFVPQIIVG